MMALRPRKTACHVCHGEDITVNDKGVLVRHWERIVVKGGKVVFRCAGSGEKPEPVEVDA